MIVRALRLSPKLATSANVGDNVGDNVTEKVVDNVSHNVGDNGKRQRLGTSLTGYPGDNVKGERWVQH